MNRLLIALLSVVSAGIVVSAGQTPAPAAPAAQAAPAPTGTQVPTIELGPGLRAVPDYRKLSVAPPAAQIPEGFTPLFNGRDLTGWHVSQTARHGVTPNFEVVHGMILGSQRPLGSGGLLITDRKFRDFEFYMEVKPDWGNDSGVFFRTTETGVAYQITMDYLPNGSMGRMIAEGGIQVTTNANAARGAAPAQAASAGNAGSATAPPAGRGAGTPDAGMTAWKREDWNTVRIRVQGDAPHATVWINGQQISDATDSENHAIGGMIEGPIAIQIHGGDVRWQPGGFWRWRNLAIKELPR